MLWTIGHLTRPIEVFVGLLESHGIQLLVDVRSIPFSRRNPQFHQEALTQSLWEAVLQYPHTPELGTRKSRPDCANVGGRNKVGIGGLYANAIRVLSLSRDSRRRWASSCLSIGNSLRSKNCGPSRLPRRYCTKTCSWPFPFRPDVQGPQPPFCQILFLFPSCMPTVRCCCET